MRRLLPCLAVSILLVLPAHAQQRVDAEAEAAANRQTTSPTAAEASRTFARALVAFALTPSPDCATLERFYLALVQYIDTHPNAYSNPRATMEDARTRRDATCDSERARAAAPVPLSELFSPAKDAARMAAQNAARQVERAAQDAALIAFLRLTGADEATVEAEMAARRERDASWARFLAEQDAEADAAHARSEASHAYVAALEAANAAAQAATAQQERRAWLWASPTITTPPVVPLPRYGRDMLEIVGRAARPGSAHRVAPLWSPSAAVPRPSPPLIVAPLIAGPPSLVGEDGTYLGTLSSNRYDPNSISNPYGRYGSRYSADSVNNPYGKYGSPYSPHSATNPYTTQAPKIVNPYLGRLSTNPYATDSTSNTYGSYGSPYSPSSIMNPYSPYGSLFSPSSVTNPYAIAPLQPLTPLPLTGR